MDNEVHNHQQQAVVVSPFYLFVKGSRGKKNKERTHHRRIATLCLNYMFQCDNHNVFIKASQPGVIIGVLVFS
jgi:hypothetical protein